MELCTVHTSERETHPKERRDKIRYGEYQTTRRHFHNEMKTAADTNDRIFRFSQQQGRKLLQK